MTSFEVLLPVGAVGFYLYDAVVMLYGNEFTLERHAEVWRSSAGFRMLVAGRRPYLPNPFAPDVLLFRVKWDVATDRHEHERFDPETMRRVARPLRVIVFAQAILLLVVLPPVSLTLGAGRLLLLVFVAYYALSIGAIGVLWARRAALSVSPQKCALLTFESLACAPFAVNLVRKLSLARSRELPWLEIAEQYCSQNQRDELSHCIVGQIQEYLAIEEPGSAEADRLEAVRAHIKERLHGAVAP